MQFPKIRPETGRGAHFVQTRRCRQHTATPLETLENRTMFAADPALSVTSHCVTEPASGSSAVTFTVTLDQPATSTLRVNYATSDGGALAALEYKFDRGATAGRDFAVTKGRLTFEPGETTKTVDVPILADAITEREETFSLNLTVFNGPGTIADGQGVATIMANTSAPVPTTSTFAVADRVVAAFPGTNGRTARVSLRGPGTGTVTLLGGGAVGLSFVGTSADTVVTINGSTLLRDIDVNGSLKSFIAKSSDLGGDMTVDGSVNALALRNAMGGSLDIAGASPLSLTFVNVCDFNVSAPTINALKLNRWMDTDAVRDLLSASTISSMNVKDCFRADVEADAIGTIDVRGTLSGSDMSVTSEVRVARVGSMLDSRLFVGVIGGTAAGLPDSRSDLAGSSRVGEFTVAGKGANVFGNSSIAAVDLGTMLMGTVRATNGGTPFGLYADRIASLTGVSAETGGFAFTGLDQAYTARAEIDFRVTVL